MPWYEHFISVDAGLFWGIVLFGIPYAVVYGLISLGRRFLHQGRLETAGRLLGPLRFLPMPAQLRFSLEWHLGRVRVGQGKTEDGLRAFDRAIRRLHPVECGASIADVLSDRAAALEEAGRFKEAAGDRRRALERLEHAPDSAETDLTRGLLLAGLKSWDESLDSVTKSLQRTPQRNREKRAEVMGWLALTCFAALRTHEALAWADRSLTDIRDVAWRAALEEVAVEALIDLRRFPEALERADASLAATETSPASTTPPGHADRLRAAKMHAEHYLARLDATRATMEQIADPESRVRALLLRSRIHALYGDWDAARADLLAAREMLAAGVSARTWWFPAMAALYMADIAADTGRPDEARAEMAAGLEVLGTDEGARRWLDAFVAWVYARIGDHEAARRSIAAMMERWDRVEGLPAGTRDRIDLARTHESLGEYAQARDLWHEFFERGPAPVEVPEACYRLGRCHEALGDVAAARAAYAQAASPGLDTHYARQAESRLREMGSPEA